MSDLLNGQPAPAEGGQPAPAEGGQPAPAEGGQQQSATPAQPAAPQEQGARVTLSDLKIPEGVTVAESDLELLLTALGDGANRDTIQKLVDLESGRQKSLMDTIKAARDNDVSEWEKAAKIDKEYGGENFDKNLAAAQEALNALATPELKALLSQTGIGSHPEVVRLFVKLAPMVREPRPGAAGGAAPKAPTRLELLYGQTN